MRVFLFVVVFMYCNSAVSQTAFQKLDYAKTGIDFQNNITETTDLNYFYFDYIYNGGGVAIGDINNDGLEDVFFTGNQVPDRLYMNNGGLEFKDITETSGINNNLGWHTGAAMVDINADGWLDIYVCRSGPSDQKENLQNLLYINNGNGTFIESALELGLAGNERSVQASFLDFDRDGDIDVFIANHPKNISVLSANTQFEGTTSRMYKNENGRFLDVTKVSGLYSYAYSLAATVADLNGDGWSDIYVTNDFQTADYLYINQKNGTFKNEITKRTGHVSTFSMGVDIADINNDLLLDVYVLDMISEDRVRSKKNMGGMNAKDFWQNVKMGQHYQYMYNTLQLNSSVGIFQEIAHLAGIAETDWSWAPLIADFDNDGWKDLFVSNGILRDVRDNDCRNNFEAKYGGGQLNFDPLFEIDKIPQSKVANYMFHNNGDLTFSPREQEWGLDELLNSNGAAYADLDNDGDLDLVINNLQEMACVYENKLSENTFLQIQLKGTSLNHFAIGAKIYLESQNTHQFQELYPTRGFQSSVPNLIHFGLVKGDKIKELLIVWPDGKRTIMTGVKPNKRLLVEYEKLAELHVDKEETMPPLLEKGKNKMFEHRENLFDDFDREVLLPNKMSQLGPFIGVGDANADGLDDFFVGGALGQPGSLLLQTEYGFVKTIDQPWKYDAVCEDLGSVFVDIDGDSDLDLYVVSGGNEAILASENLMDRIYENNGNGKFSKYNGVLPNSGSGQAIVAEDYDQDGDMDLFLPGRQIPGNYPMSPKSSILQNKKGVFIDVTSKICPEFEYCGMVSDILFWDVDNDLDKDMIIVGEWMPVTVFENRKGRYYKSELNNQLNDTYGWWNCIEPFDIDQDGKEELLLGNIGSNNKFHPSVDSPLELYYSDFDDNGNGDIVLAEYQDEKLYPVRGRECSAQQMPSILNSFPSYSGFAEAVLEDVYQKNIIQESLRLKANEFRSGYLDFIEDEVRFVPFENFLQLGPVNGFGFIDVNSDGHKDIILAGSKLETEIETPRYDGNIGAVLLQTPRKFILADPELSGFYTIGNVKDVKVVGDWVVVGFNNAEIQVFRRNP